MPNDPGRPGLDGIGLTVTPGNLILCRGKDQLIAVRCKYPFHPEEAKAIVWALKYFTSIVEEHEQS